MAKKYSYEQVKDFAHLVCMVAQKQLPKLTSLDRSLTKRSAKHIYLDYLQNRKGQTIASAYCLRPKPGATVSTPLNWNELKKGLTPLDFTIHNTLDRLKRKGDLFKGILGKGIDMENCIDKLTD
jgi:bifunctional non-homologous end joining protein LigD